MGEIMKRCWRSDYMRLSYEEREKLMNDFIALIKNKYPKSNFDYDSFPELDYEYMTFSTLFHELKEAGYIRSVGPGKFELTGL